MAVESFLTLGGFMRFSFKFSTLSGPTEVIYGMNELIGTDMEKYAKRVLAMFEMGSGIVGATYDTPEAGKLEINIIDRGI